MGAPDSDGDERQTTPPTQIPVNVGAPPEYYPQHTAPVYQPHLPQYYPSGQQQSNTTVVVAQQVSDVCVCVQYLLAMPLFIVHLFTMVSYDVYTIILYIII